MIVETKMRSILKSTSYRAIGTLSTIGLIWFATGKLVLALGLGGAEGVSKIILYFLHERLWSKIKIGKREVSPVVIWITGLPGAGKSTLGNVIAKKLKSQGLKVELLDGEAIRNIFPNIGYSVEERYQHVVRVGHLASMLEKNGLIVIVTMVSPFEDSRIKVKQICENFIEVHASTPIEYCEKNDRSGNYEKARRGEIKNFTGVNQTYEAPRSPEFKYDHSVDDIEVTSDQIIKKSIKTRAHQG